MRLVMESTELIKNGRENKSEQFFSWLKKVLPGSLQVQALIGDASFRKYYRVRTQHGSFIAMDDSKENDTYTFVTIAKALRALDILTPEIFESDCEQGFLLITDFGDDTYLKKLNQNNASLLYHEAIKLLPNMQTCQSLSNYTLPHFDQAFMWREWTEHKRWFLRGLLKMTDLDEEKKLDECVKLIIDAISMQPQVFMHRDYHSSNLMVLNNNKVGVLDFQDACMGPITYDLVSLLRDCYLDWPKEKVIEWLLFYLKKQHAYCDGSIDAKQFIQWFDFMSMQRHLKNLFIFSRKFLRDQNNRYLVFMPRTINYVLQASKQYEISLPIYKFYKKSQSLLDQEISECVQ